FRAATIVTAPDGTQTFSFEPVIGRYVNIFLPGNDEVLTLCEVEVSAEKDTPLYICSPRNLVLGATAVQSSTYDELAAAQKAIDGNRNSIRKQGSCSHTKDEKDPWWRVDLLEVYEVTRVSITNRGDGYAQRINGAQIRIGNSLENNGNNNELAATVESIPPGDTKTFEFKPIKGQYVNIFIPERNEYLTLCEVEVFAEQRHAFTDRPEQCHAFAMATPSVLEDVGGIPAIESAPAAAPTGEPSPHPLKRRRRRRKKAFPILQGSEAFQEAAVGPETTPENVFLTEDGYLNLGDFGCSKALESRSVSCSDRSSWRNHTGFTLGAALIVTGVGVGAAGGATGTVSNIANAVKQKSLCESLEKMEQIMMAIRVIVFLTLTGLCVAVSRGNLALNAKAVQSSTCQQGDAERAVDGNRGSCSHTNSEFNPWWRIDLGNVYSVHKVTITNRGDCCKKRLKGAQIRIGNSLDNNGNDNELAATLLTVLDVTETFSFEPVIGRYVNIYLPGNDKVLTLCEVEVSAENYTPMYITVPRNLALGATAVQSSTYDELAAAQKAIDGNRNSIRSRGSCSHTKADRDPWWRVDLLEVYKISRVSITNRGDCCPERINGAQIRIGNSLENNGNNNELSFSEERMGRQTSSGAVGNTVVDPECWMGNSGSNVFLTEDGYLNLGDFGCSKALESRSVSCSDRSSWRNHTGFTLGAALIVTGVGVGAAGGATGNLALGATAVQSSTYDQLAAAQKAIDGNRNSIRKQGSCSHTKDEKDPWWRVDLLEVYEVTRVSITNRGDGYAQRINGAQIRIGNSLENNGNNNELAATVESIPPGDTKTFEFKPIKGQYVNIFIPERNEYLTLCEVEVFAVTPESAESILVTAGLADITAVPPEFAELTLQSPLKREEFLSLLQRGCSRKFSRKSFQSLSPVSTPAPEPSPVSAPAPEHSPVSAPAPEPSPVSAPAPEPSSVSAPAPEPSSVLAPAPEPSLVSAPAPEHSLVSAPAPEPSPVSAPAPEPSPVSAPAPEPSPVSAPAPEPSPVSAPAPEPSSVSAPAPEPSLVSAPVPEPSSVFCEVDTVMNSRMAIRVIVFLTLTGLCVADTKGNLALNAKAVQSSTYPLGDAEHAVDGDRDSNYRKGSCSQTKAEFNPWWRVDLGNVYSVSNITITNLGDCCRERLMGAQIRIGNSLANNGNNNVLVATLLTIINGTETFSFESVNGRYVNILLPGNDEILTLCEVEVFADKSTPLYVCVPKNLALGATAVQSSIYETSAAQKAVDGNRDSIYNLGSCSHTKADRDPWWRVDLLEVFEITRVSITNLGDGGAERINGAQIRIGNSLENNGNNNELAATVVSIQRGETRTFKFKPIKGRYVNIIIPGRNEFLVLCEVEVYEGE
ncbi:uncharacterized protein LOC125276079, partial [Megalobrama amblycephala]|uniref:uncharacterized protein LOC125276079 n=1 Tax=Megalobrama amblycephala TaxID=75352 RepID=UPI002014514D